MLISFLYFVVFAAGSVVLFKALFAIYIIARIFTTKLNAEWAQKYGRGSYAIVTGCTQGIGRAFCFQLAKLQFNLVIISRNQQKLQTLKTQLISEYPKLTVLIIVADFSQYSKSMYDQMYQKLDGLDIGLLVNNVGIGHIKRMHQLSLREIQEQININVNSMAHLSYRLLPKLLKRNKKSGIINLSSHSIACPFRNLAVYTGTKAFNDLFSRCLAQDYRKQLDILSSRPCIVTSAGTNNSNDWTACTSEQCARSTIKALGKTDVTSGHWTHILQAWTSNILGESLTHWVGNLKLNTIEQAKRQ